MSDIFKKVSPGDPQIWRAPTYNGLMDVATYVQSIRDSSGGRASFSAGQFQKTTIIRNDTGADRLTFDIVGLGDPIYLPSEDEAKFVNYPIMAGKTPVLATHLNKFAILLEPVKANALGYACTLGVCPVKINKTTATVAYAGIIASDCNKLQGAASGAEVLWSETGTGVKWALVRMGNSLPPIPDPTKDYMLIYDATAKVVRWAETTTTCP